MPAPWSCRVCTMLNPGDAPRCTECTMPRQQGGTSQFGSTSPPSPEEAGALVDGMTLAGKPLGAPRFHITGWQPGQFFTEADDPDRTGLPWEAPEFVLRKDPRAQSRKTRATDLQLPGGRSRGDSFAKVVRGVMDEKDCAALLRAVNEKGFTPALLNYGNGSQCLMPDARDGHRVIVDSPALSEWLGEVLRPHLPESLAGMHLDGLNERCRFLCYTPGQQFPGHTDGRYCRPRGHPKHGDCSLVTVQFYLHDVPRESGGATTFFPGSSDSIPCQPEAGSVLLFTQDLYHEGSLLSSGVKYTLRTEAMYSRAPRPRGGRG